MEFFVSLFCVWTKTIGVFDGGNNGAVFSCFRFIFERVFADFYFFTQTIEKLFTYKYGFKKSKIKPSKMGEKTLEKRDLKALKPNKAKLLPGFLHFLNVKSKWHIYMLPSAFAK